LQSFKKSKERKCIGMKKKFVLRPWVKVVLLLLPEVIIISQLFFIGHKIGKLIEVQEKTTVVVETRCYHED
jgi:hypothetical protein